MSAQRILVVDDEPFNLEIIADTLADRDYQLNTASSGEAAWQQLLGGESFDLVVLDRMMPGMDGMELLRRIKADPRFADVPVVMQTAAASADKVREGLAAGAYYYLTKPFELEALRLIVHAALADAQRRRRLRADAADQAALLGMLDSAAFRVRDLEDAQRLAGALGRLSTDPERVALCLSELLINAVEHGNLGIGFADKGRLKADELWPQEVTRRLALRENEDKWVRVEAARRGDTWRFMIEDRGPGFDWKPFLDFDPARAFAPNGRGIALVCRLAGDDLHFEGAGNRVALSARAWVPARD